MNKEINNNRVISSNKEVIHLFITNDCDHKCPLCCNKQYNINKDIPVVSIEELQKANTICITGGEPFLKYSACRFLPQSIKRQYPNIQNIYIYTSGHALANYLLGGFGDLLYIDGLNISPKNDTDIRCLNTILNQYYIPFTTLKSNRIYVYPEHKEAIEKVLNKYHIFNTEIIYREWQEEFKPNGDIFRRLPILY
jgi:hypothetical protein